MRLALHIGHEHRSFSLSRDHLCVAARTLKAVLLPPPSFWIALFASCLFVGLLPVVRLVLLRLTTDRKLMGCHVSGWVTNTVVVLVAFAAFYLNWQETVKLRVDLAGRF